MRILTLRIATLLAFLMSTLALAGCGGADDVEVSLPFVGDIMAKAKKKEEKIANRGSLVLPPNAKALPAPTEKQAAPTGAWPQDPDQLAKQEAEIAAAKEKDYQKNGDWKGERNSGNGLEDFKNKTDWNKRQPGIYRSLIKKTEQ